VLAVAAVLVVFLGVLGLHVERKLSPSTLDIPGTEASRANDMLREHFGPSSPFAILLRGPADELDRQGPHLIRVLRHDPAVTTLSPWDKGAVKRLRPGPNRALIIADFHNPVADAVRHTVPELNETLERQIQPPVRATQTGFATISRAIQDESIAASERSEIIALPILVIVLLLVFRSPLAAAIPLTFGAITVFSSRGLLAILTHWFDVDALALTVCTMMGLALGVDYALLMVSRFREELVAGVAPVDAARVTRHTAGRTTVFAGSTLILSMLVAFFVVPGALLASLAATLAMVVALSVTVATILGPAVLTLLGSNINRWRIGAPAPAGRSRLMILVSAALRRPAAVAALIGLIVLVLAAPAVALKTGPLSPAELPKHNGVREDYDLITREIGAGFEAPFVIVAAAKEGTMTEPERLAALSKWQRRIAHRRGVQLVIGPAQVTKAVAPLRRSGNNLLASEKTGPGARLEKLGHNLNRAAGGVKQLRSGLSRATNGASLLADGSSRAGEGATEIASGLARAATGGSRAVDALGRFASGTERLAGGQEKFGNKQELAREGAFAVQSEGESLANNVKRNGLGKSRKLQKRLSEAAHGEAAALEASAQAAAADVHTALEKLEAMTVGKSDQNYGPTLEALRQAASHDLPGEAASLQTQLTKLSEEAREVTFWWTSTVKELNKLARHAKELHEGEEQLVEGGEKLEGGSQELNSGADRLATESKKLSSGLGRLSPAASTLANGLTRLTGGATQLQESLAVGYHRSYPLQTGLNRATVRVLSQSRSLNRQTNRLKHRSPGIFNSGYFVLSALDGATPALRSRASSAIDLKNGGQAATIFVISRYNFNSPGSIDLNKRLEDDASGLEKEAGVNAGVAGGAAQLNTYSHVARARIPYVVAAITFATFLVMLLVLRALPLAAIAVGLNLATVGVAFGVLTLLFNVPDGYPLGGRTYVDAIGATMIFGVVFGLSIDYAVFLLVRMRERYEADDGHADAITFGLEKTASVITGAAIIMMAVFVAFAAAPIATTSQLGVGLTVAVLLDATVVRIVLLPALMLLLGDRVWWLPRPLERLLPRIDV
jgi:putative drug exporter of the RND superfamily